MASARFAQLCCEKISGPFHGVCDDGPFARAFSVYKVRPIENEKAKKMRKAHHKKAPHRFINDKRAQLLPFCRTGSSPPLYERCLLRFYFSKMSQNGSRAFL